MVACGQHRSSRISTSPWTLASCLVLGCLETALVPNQEGPSVYPAWSWWELLPPW